MYFGDEFPAYERVGDRKKKAQKKIAELRKKGRTVAPVVIDGKKIANSAWGIAWCDHVESYSDYASRLPKGRTYVKNGFVLDLQLEPGKLRALVQGSDLYEVTATIAEAKKAKWNALVKECAGKIDSVVELLSGRVSASVMEVLCRKQSGLFPSPEEIELECSCPDGAYLCKHLAAVLYGIGARLDEKPELLFVMRGVDQLDLVSRAGRTTAKVGKKKAKNALSEDSAADLAGLFGIELEATAPPPAPAQPKKHAARSKRA